jgi:hypothetical protein
MFRASAAGITLSYEHCSAAEKFFIFIFRTLFIYFLILTKRKRDNSIGADIKMTKKGSTGN